MSITRSLLSKLHLPYKQLGIDGSRGDQLYLPDDVGVNLSLSHSLNGSDMVPNNSSKNGSVYTNGLTQYAIPALTDCEEILKDTLVDANIDLPPLQLDGYSTIILFFTSHDSNPPDSTTSLVLADKDEFGNQIFLHNTYLLGNGNTSPIILGANYNGTSFMSPLYISMFPSNPGTSNNVRIRMLKI